MSSERIVPPWVAARLVGAVGGVIAFAVPGFLIALSGDLLFGFCGTALADVFVFFGYLAYQDVVVIRPGIVTIRGREYRGVPELQGVAVVPWELEFSGRIARRVGSCVVLLDSEGRILETPLAGSNRESVEAWHLRLTESIELPSLALADVVIREKAWP